MAFGKIPSEEAKINPINPLPSQGLGLGSQSAQTSLGAFLGSGSKIHGQLAFSGPVEIDGSVDGEIVAQDKLTLGESASIKGTIHGSEILVKGAVQGDIVASKKLVIKKPARIIGNISTPSLTIEEGVTFDGKCVMSSQGASTQPKMGSKSPDLKITQPTQVVAAV